MTEHTIEQIPCYIEAHIVSKSAQNIHVIYLGIDEHDLKGLETTCELIKESCPDCSYIIVSYMPGGWNTEAMYEIIQANANVENHILEWNQGKHFKDVPQRIAKGIVWSLQH